MGLLPRLRRGSDRWWLPRSAQASEAIGHLMIASGHGRQIDDATRSLVRDTLQSDPPLLIFASLSWTGQRVDANQLVDWLAENLVNRFAGGEAFLGAPTVTTEIRQRWKKLGEYYRTVSFEKWLEDAALWLEVTGPPVSSAWREQWPSLDACPDVIGPSSDKSADCCFQQLARMMQHHRALEQSFDERLHKSKLSALKQLAYGLSHEINNPLANISTRAQQLQRGESDPSRQATLQRIVDQVYRAHEMIADLMFYANPPSEHLKRNDLCSTLNSVADSFREEVDRQAIRLEVTLPDEPVEATVDANMIGEAVRALVRNAVDAIGCQGTVVMSLVRESDRVMIHIADSGPGLSNLAREHAFDPYFSGREAGRGLGLGLCRAYRIARIHHGEITLAGGPTGCVATITLFDA